MHCIYKLLYEIGVDVIIKENAARTFSEVWYFPVETFLEKNYSVSKVLQLFSLKKLALELNNCPIKECYDLCANDPEHEKVPLNRKPLESADLHYCVIRHRDFDS